MHRARAEHDRAPASDCALRGTCGADAALGALLWQQGVLAEPTLTPPDLQAGAMEPAAPVDVHGLVTPPDSPPSWERGRGDPVVRAIAGSGSSRAMREIES